MKLVLQVPSWAKQNRFFQLREQKKELLIVCHQNKIPRKFLCKRNWRGFKVKGPLDFSFYKTDYVFVKEKDFKKAKTILKKFFKIE